jgi:hypothetical protein
MEECPNEQESPEKPGRFTIVVKFAAKVTFPLRDSRNRPIVTQRATQRWQNG